MNDSKKSSGKIIINIPEVTQSADKTRVTAKIDLNGQTKALWFEVGAEYAQYLCPERGDGLVIAMLWLAMRNGCDIECKVPVTAELKYQIEEHLVPVLARHSSKMYATRILAEEAELPVENAEAVGTGISCGIDSLYSLKQNIAGWKGKKLTHLALYNVGAFGNFDENKRDSQFKWQIENSLRLCKEVGLKLVVANTNLKADFWSDFRYTHTYCNVFAVYMLQKLWGTYFYASAGMGMPAFSVISADELDCAHYDIYLLACLSTRRLKFYSNGAAVTRFDKTAELAEWDLSKRFLHVCCHDEGKNCGKCFKCKRTLVCLDALGKLDEFADVFDIGYYREHRSDYLKWLILQSFNRKGEEWCMISSAYDVIVSRGGLSLANRVGAVLMWLKSRLRKYKTLLCICQGGGCGLFNFLVVSKPLKPPKPAFARHGSGYRRSRFARFQPVSVR